MFSTENYAVAHYLAKNNPSMLFGVSALDGKWYVGERVDLEKVGVPVNSLLDGYTTPELFYVTQTMLDTHPHGIEGWLVTEPGWYWRIEEYGVGPCGPFNTARQAWADAEERKYT